MHGYTIDYYRPRYSQHRTSAGYSLNLRHHLTGERISFQSARHSTPLLQPVDRRHSYWCSSARTFARLVSIAIYSLTTTTAIEVHFDR